MTLNAYPDNSPPGQFPTDCTRLIGPDEWFYSVVVVLVGSCPGGELVLGIVSRWAMVGLYFYPVGELSLVGSCPRTP